MLNKQLWEMILKLDPNAQVHNEDSPGICQLPAKESSTLFGSAKKRLATYASMLDWGECYSMNCPTCGDTRSRLYICHRYGTSIRSQDTTIQFGKRGMVHCHNEECQINEIHRDAFWKWLHGSIELPKGYARAAVSIDVKPRTLDPASMHLMSSIELPSPRYSILAEETPPEILEYIRERGYDPVKIAAEWNISYCPAGAVYPDSLGEDKTLYDGRIIIPTWQHGRCVYWQGRSIRKNAPLKYINPGAGKTSLLYNADNAMMYPDVVIFEGPINCWRFGKASVALLGKNLSSGQKAIMKALWGYDGCGIVCLDEDVYTRDRFGRISNRDLKHAEALLKDKVFPRGVAVLRLRNGDADRHIPERLWQLASMAVKKAVTDPSKVRESIVDECYVTEPPPEDIKPPAVDSLVEYRYNLDIEDEDGLDGDWESSDIVLSTGTECDG